MNKRIILTITLILLVSFPAWATVPNPAHTWPNGFGYTPSQTTEGTTNWTATNQSQGRIDAKLGKLLLVGDPTYPTFTAAVATLNTAATDSTLRLPAGTHTVAVNTTVNKNINLMPDNGALITIPTGVTLTINGHLNAGLYQIFSCTGTGKVVFGRPNGVKELVPQWWGAAGDGSNDDTIPLQAMVDCSVASGGIPIFLPGGSYKITDTWKLNKGVDYAGFVVHGDGSTGSGFGTVIDATAFGDRPAVNIQGARHMIVEGFQVVGKNAAPLTASGTLDPVMANWITVGCSNTQYAPYAGISIDAYQGTKPTGGYSNDVYGRKDSSYMVLRNVAITGFTVGLCVSPANISNDSDSISVDDCEIFYNTFGYSNGSTQSRSVIFKNTNVFGNWCGFTTLRHGQKTGNHPSIFGGVFQTSHKIFELGSANEGNPAAISGIHAESFGWLGELGVVDSGQTTPIVFSGCNLAFNGSAYQSCFLVAHRRAKFDSCFIKFDGTTYVINFGGSTYYGLVQFDNCMFEGFANSIYAFLGIRSQNFANQSFHNCAAESIAYTDTGDNGRYNPNRDVNIDGVAWQYYITRYFLTPNVATVNIQGTTYKVARPNDYGYNSSSFSVSDLTAALSGTTHGSTLTFTASNPAEFQVGDIIIWRVWEPYAGNVFYNDIPALRVTANNAGACVATVLFDGIDAAYATGRTGLYVCTPFFCNPTESTGATHSNTTVDGVTTIANWKIGDFIQGAGIPVNTRIANIVGTTITLSKAATATAVGVPLYNCRLVPENGQVAIPTPAVPATTVEQANANAFPVKVTVTGGTVTVIAIGPTGATAATGATTGAFILQPGWCIKMTYSVAPTWAWATAY